MAFKSVVDYNAERYRGKFRIPSNSESVDVIFMYQSKADMLIGDVHYIKSNEYSGYVHCLGAGCPACAIKKDDGSMAIRIQTKLFVPIYNISTGAVEFWDRSPAFEHQMDEDVFDKGYANPSEYIFRITRHGGYKDRDTHYDILPVARNTLISYDAILAKLNIKFPDCYEDIVKSVPYADMTRMLQNRSGDGIGITQEYVPVPRAGYAPSIPSTYVDAADAVSSMPETPVMPTIPAVPVPPVPPVPNFIPTPTEITPGVAPEPKSELPFEIDTDDGEVGPEPNF